MLASPARMGHFADQLSSLLTRFLFQNQHVSENQNASDDCVVLNTNSFPNLLSYCQNLKKLENSNINHNKQQARHLAHLLRWSIVDRSVYQLPVPDPEILPQPQINLDLLKTLTTDNRFQHLIQSLEFLVNHHAINTVSNGVIARILNCWRIQKNHFVVIDNVTLVSAMTSAAFYHPTPSCGLGSTLTEEHIKVALWSRILADTFFPPHLGVTPPCFWKRQRWLIMV